ncbi:MAG: DNA polymerase V [Bacteroidetes bacterium RIFCSPLOWO2_12_FULL_35_15]|nr:MAG: DNA polymerase V [Bacteroidetes bacterium RIFCSPLOWO2_12_FULL_35_15]
MEFLFLIIGLSLGFVIAFLFFKSKNNGIIDTSLQDAKIIELDKQNAVLKTQLENAAKEYERLDYDFKTSKEQLIHDSGKEKEKLQVELNSEKEKLSKAESRIARAEEIFKSQEEKFTTLKSELENVHKRYTTEFENIANKILDEKSKKFTDQNKTNLDIILNPLKEKIKDFEDKVDKAYKAESTERTTLKAEIKNLIDLNKQVSEDANNLAKALKGENKTQGNWGELILEKVLERSGLVKDQEYRLQFSTNNDEGKRIQPDAVIMLPDNKHIVVDSKVSLVAYEAVVKSENEEDRLKFVKDHIASVRNHVKMLSEKNYQSSTDFNTPDFVLLFIPIESSFSIAVQADQELFNFAWDKKIVIVSPSTLLATLRTIASVWKQERQTKNAIEIAKQSGALYDKFVGFIEDMDKIKKGIDSSGLAYDNAINKLQKGSGNLVKRALDIEKLGAKTTKQISSKFIESDEPSQLTEDTES